MLRLSLLPLFSIPLALLLAPLAHAQFSTDNTPACCRTCYASTLTQYDAIKPGEAGSLRAWCADGGFTSALKSCWDQTCVRCGSLEGLVGRKRELTDGLRLDDACTVEPCGRRQGPAAMGRRLLVRRLDFVYVRSRPPFSPRDWADGPLALAAMWDQAHSSAAVKVATVPGTTVLPLVVSSARLRFLLPPLTRLVSSFRRPRPPLAPRCRPPPPSLSPTPSTSPRPRPPAPPNSSAPRSSP